MGAFGVPPHGFDLEEFQEGCNNLSIPSPMEIEFVYDEDDELVGFGLLYNPFVPLMSYLQGEPTWEQITKKIEKILTAVITMHNRNDRSWLPNDSMLVGMPGFGGTIIQPDVIVLSHGEDGATE